MRLITEKYGMSTFDSCTLQEMCAFFSWETRSNVINRTSIFLRPFIEHLATMHSLILDALR